ncbi:hypothetical protein [Aurantibacillus circumpalustris]|uniref:hypothetical protein n=1 Tax=Aurantibacillus circumpalustris TaxID=3036359 RepID=UPI00295B526A|nr:hypothetical protein [Aurantibacillus circumpalustris]
MKRPRIISIICIIGYLAVLITFPQVFSPPIKKLGMFMPALFGILISAQFIACVGVWYYKQWGVQMYLLAFFAKTIFFLTTQQTGFSFYFGGLISLVSIILLLRHYPKMNPNL